VAETRTPIDINAVIQKLKQDRDTARVQKQKAEIEAASKSAVSKEAKRIKAQANIKFQYASNLESSLNDYEGKLNLFATKIARGDELTAVEEKELNRITEQYNKVNTAYNKAVSEGNSILSKLPEEPPKEGDQPPTDGGTPPTTNLGGYSGIPTDLSGKVYPPVGNVPISEYLISVNLGGKEKVKELQLALKAAGPKIYKGPVDGVYRAPELSIALQKADQDIGYYETTGITFKDRLDALQRLAATRTGGEGVTPTTTISPLATATTYINNALKRAGVNRDATPEEIASLTKVLNDAESRFRTTTIGGVTRDLLGDRTQFITNLITTGKYVDPNTGKSIKGLKGDVKKAAAVLGTLSKSAKALKADTRSLTIQSLQSTARANGVTLSQQQLDQYALDVQNGKDPKVIQNQIRNLAGLGMPDSVKKLLAEGTDLETIYSPYKQTMAAVLELNPETISFADSTLRSAIGPNGETPLYDFQRALRKDPRWQYTNNAREDVFQSVGKVLQDFGFQG
jgi:archaellum component FlaC